MLTRDEIAIMRRNLWTVIARCDIVFSCLNRNDRLLLLRLTTRICANAAFTT